MKRSAVFSVVIAALVLAAAAPLVQAQAVFKIPFKFESSGKKFRLFLYMAFYLMAKINF